MIFRVLSLVVWLSALSAFSDERGKSLKTALKGATKLEITDTQSDDRTTVTFKLDDQKAIRDLINSLAFESESHGYCACIGDCLITFFRNDQKLATLTYHHGTSLRWKNWNGDSNFTDDSQKAWRTWFQKHGEPRFQEAYESEVQREKNQRELRHLFFSGFPARSQKIIKEYEEALEKHLRKDHLAILIEEDSALLDSHRKRFITSFANRQDLATTISKALGAPCLEGWMWDSTNRITRLVFLTAKELHSQDFKKALNFSDPATLLGLARLFCFGELARKIPKDRRAPIFAKLIETVAQHDKGGNATWLFQWLDQYSSPELTNVLERIALGKLSLPSSPINLSQDLSFPHYACLLLSKTKSPHFQKCLKHVSSTKPEYPGDPLALTLARANRDSEFAIPKNIFDSYSTTICLNALSLLERKRSKESLNFIITKATRHEWSHVRNDAVFAIERMTGKKWFQNQKDERAESHVMDIRDWWQKEKSTFQFPQ